MSSYASVDDPCTEQKKIKDQKRLRIEMNLRTILTEDFIESRYSWSVISEYF